MQRLLENKDAMQAVAAALTREEAGKLARVCKAASQFVRDADNQADAGRPDGFVACAPMWDLERTRARVAARYPESMPMPRDFWRAETMRIMNCLAAELVRMQEVRIVRLVFERAAARVGRKLSLFGCHKLEVLDEYAFLTDMSSWFAALRQSAPSGALARWACVKNKPSRRVLLMLQEGGLRVRGKLYRVPLDARYVSVHKSEALWHSAYWAW
jgi:hypothetical protein